MWAARFKDMMMRAADSKLRFLFGTVAYAQISHGAYAVVTVDERLRAEVEFPVLLLSFDVIY